jgi:hypothetical protein
MTFIARSKKKDAIVRRQFILASKACHSSMHKIQFGLYLPTLKTFCWVTLWFESISL